MQWGFGLREIDDDLVTRLDELAKGAGISRSELLRRGAFAVLEADRWLQADGRLIEGYQKYPPDPVLVEASRQLASESVPEW